MDRKIELDNLSEEMFQEIMTAVSADVLNIAKEAQEKINELLIRFNIRCEMSLSYSVDAVVKATVPPSDENLPLESATPVKKKRASKKSSQDLEGGQKKKRSSKATADIS